jgi:hypothetical protein
MAHPSNLIGSNPHYITGDVTATLSGDDYFHTVTVSTGGTLAIKGGGIFEFLASGADGTGHIDPDTGVAHTENTDAAGFYEALGSTPVSFVLTAGITIYGRFTEIDSDGTAISIAYK